MNALLQDALTLQTSSSLRDEAIGKGAFENCVGLTDITIPASITEVQTSAFSDCANLKKVTVLGNVKTLGTGIFFGCKNLRISNITFPKDHHWSLKNIGILN